MLFRWLTYSLPIVGLFLIAKIGFVHSKSSKPIVLEPNTLEPKTYQRGSHGSHCSHASHYSCMSKVDSIETLTKKQIVMIKANLCDSNVLLVKMFVSNADISRYERNVFNGKAIIVVTKECVERKAKKYRINYIIIPRNKDIENYYYIEYKEFIADLWCNSFISSIGHDLQINDEFFIKNKEIWMYKL